MPWVATTIGRGDVAPMGTETTASGKPGTASGTKKVTDLLLSLRRQPRLRASSPR
jgi:hypothetical protein